MKNILIAGGTGFIGNKLANNLYAEGHNVSLLSRNPSQSGKFPVFGWDPANGKIDQNALQNIDIVINLAGSGIAKLPWSKKRKSSIYNSRILSTRLLVDSIINNEFKPLLFITVSATGYYGHREGEKISELSPAGTDFLSRVCKDWENETLRLKDLEIPVAIIRTGIVLSNKGGSLPVLLIPFKFRLNVLFNKGIHFVSWIHIDDMTKIFSGIINKKLLPGLYNAVSPMAVSQKKFNDAICSIMGRKTLNINIPKKLIEIFMGEMASVIIDDQNIIPAHLQAQDFNFQFQEVSEALKNLL
jgi:hypothetical protein